MTAAPALTFDDVAFAYGGRSIFRDFHWSVAPGELTGVVGPNGTGKTTLVRLAGGQLRPDAGRVRLNERDMDTLRPRERAREVAVVPQETHPAFRFTVREMVAMGRAPRQGLFGIERPEDRAAVDLALERTGTASLARRPFQRLSGGERQRVVIARALAQEPRLLLLDEPTAFLDLRHRLAVYDLLVRLNREQRLTVLVVSHEIDLVARYCRRVMLLCGGRALADGPPHEALTPDTVRAAFGVEAEVHRLPSGGHPWIVPLRPV